MKLLRQALAIAALLLAPAPALAQDTPPAAETAPAAEMGDWRPSSSLIEPTKYPDDFAHYDYVNPDAPKGGTLNRIASGSYDSFNPFILRGTAAAGTSSGVGGFGGGVIYDTLMEQSPDEPGVSHGLIAEAIRYPSDYSSVSFRLNPEARWHDGEPITVEDVLWSFETLKTLHPQWSSYYANVAEARQSGEREVTFVFDQTNNRELPNIMGDLVVLPRHWWTGQDAQGRTRDITQPTLEPPLGSGPYRIATFNVGNSVEWERVPDAWGASLPTRVGRYNFDRLRYVYLRDANASWEAFKKGGLDDWRIENDSQRWSTGYDFPAAVDGRVARETLPDHSVMSMQAYVLNNRLPKFSDRRVRKALTLAFNFEDMNRNFFYGLNKRISSYWDNSELAAKGLPSEAELRYLEPLRDSIPDEVFTQEFKLPVYDSATGGREYLREALGLLREAGYELRGTTLVNGETGEQLSIEFLGSDPSSNRTLEPYARQLERLGIRTNVRIIDPTQYIERMNNYDFELVGMRYYPQSLSPGNEQRDFWSSTAADTPGTRNYAGVKDPAVDQLIDAIITAPDRDSLVAATRALDRVMLWNYHVVPQWYRDEFWLAYWDKFGMPESQPAYAGIDPFSWWVKGEVAVNTPADAQASGLSDSDIPQ
ncbi:extracellular solute-binding protein [Aureimonas populi]|uniref:Extracellular solute-binding protein n=1 Tax=Aureimonas populi TaxID=1701758 RepID=A0ABW5CPC8_9HYPH|nr:extracellular solute-binding protein [Aureimonas populi]